MDNTFPRILLPFSVLLVAAATVLGLATAGNGTFEIDHQLASWVQRWQGDLPAFLEHIGDMSGETYTAVAVVLGGLLVATILKQWPFVLFLVTVGVLRVAGTALKPLYASPRPAVNEVTLRQMSDGYGFPSGHSMTAAMIAAIAVTVAWNVPLATRYRWMVAGLAAALMLLVGWSRVWSGAHWPTDVIGGWSYGIALVLIASVAATRFAGSGTGSRWQQSPR